MAIAGVGVLLVDCSSSLVDILANDGLNLCATVASLGLTPEPWMGVGLMVIGALGLTAAWAPTKRRRARKADLASLSALQRNLDRVEGASTPGPVHHDVSSQNPEASESLALRELIEELRQRFDTEGISNEFMTAWIATLHICNDLNNADLLNPSEFKELNTSVLALVTPDLENDALGLASPV